MGLLDDPKQGGQLCPKCSKGILEVKSGKYGGFLGCTKYPDCHYTVSVGVNIQKLATDLLKIKKKKTRRGKRKNKTTDPLWRKKVEQAMQQHKKQKKERGQMFKDFERLISE